MRRRIARESALQILYSLEGKTDAELRLVPVGETVDLFFAHFGDRQATDEDFLRRILAGTLAEYGKFNELIAHQSDHWKLERMAFVDRNILRSAVYELTYLDDVPSSVTINEAVEIAKRFGTEESGAFINGILDQIWKNLPPNPRKLAK